ncbi:MAG TPA: cytochrome c oxidase assembly protein, partial [Gemmatimonadaceae bacterium]|nr:cytochrome c oxidase assembly protein [Gemmatimonadaceae bacterium]
WASGKLRRQPALGQKIYFVSGLLVMFASLNGPIHDLSDDYLFSAHMVQHLLLTLAVPPLLLAGTPGWMLRPILSRRYVAPVAHFFTRAPMAFVVFNLTIAIWHLPPFYNAAMAHHSLHIVEHLMFMTAAVLMWWPLLSQLPELPRLAYPGQMLYSFLMSIPMSIVAVYIAMADHVLYPAYSATPRVLPLSPLEDQLLGALIMWIPGGIIFMIIMTVVFFKWNARGEDSTAGAQVDWKPSTA